MAVSVGLARSLCDLCLSSGFELALTTRVLGVRFVVDGHPVNVGFDAFYTPRTRCPCFLGLSGGLYGWRFHGLPTQVAASWYKIPVWGWLERHDRDLETRLFFLGSLDISSVIPSGTYLYRTLLGTLWGSGRAEKGMRNLVPLSRPGLRAAGRYETGIHWRTGCSTGPVRRARYREQSSDSGREAHCLKLWGRCVLLDLCESVWVSSGAEGVW